MRDVPDGGCHESTHMTAGDTFSSRFLQFWRRLVKGDFGLAATWWRYGVLGLLAQVLAFGGLAGVSAGLFFVGCLCYNVVVWIGTWRAAHRYEGPRVWAVLAYLAVALWIACVAIVGVTVLLFSFFFRDL